MVLTIPTVSCAAVHAGALLGTSTVVSVTVFDCASLRKRDLPSGESEPDMSSRQSEIFEANHSTLADASFAIAMEYDQVALFGKFAVLTQFPRAKYDNTLF